MSLLGCTYPNCECTTACEGLSGLIFGKGATPQQRARTQALTGRKPVEPPKPNQAGEAKRP